MLLLTSLAFGGSDAVEAYGHLDTAEEELLSFRASGLLQIPRDKRIPLLVQEIKRLVTQRRRQLGSADPKRLGALLKQERSSVVEVVLNALPAELASAVRVELGNPPPMKLARDVKPEVLSIIRWKLEDALRASAPQVGAFRFTDLMMLQQRDVLAVADRMGARVLATAVAGLNEDERQAFLGKLPPDQRALAQRAAEAGAARRLTEKDARLVLEMHGALEDPSLGMRSAGAQRIVRACYAQGGEFAQKFVERHHGDLGTLLSRWLKEEKGKPIKGDGGRLDIVEQLERLAQKGIIDRPMRLPPPVKGQAHLGAPPLRPPPGAPRTSTGSGAPPAAPRTSTGAGGQPAAPSRVLTALPARRNSGSAPEARPPPRSASQPEGLRPGPARDPIAAREARRAGATGAVPRSQPPGRGTDAQARIMRDGKPLDTVPPRRQTSPVQPIPRRKDAPAGRSGSTTSPARSPVLKGPGRGPGGGSR